MPPALLFFCKVALVILGLSQFQNKFENFFSISVKNAFAIFMGIALNLQIPLGNGGTLTILIIPSMRTDFLSIYLCLAKIILSVSYNFRCTGFSTPCLN